MNRRVDSRSNPPKMAVDCLCFLFVWLDVGCGGVGLADCRCTSNQSGRVHFMHQIMDVG